MVKLNKKDMSLNGADEEASGIDWQQLMANFRQSVEDALKNIMDKVNDIFLCFNLNNE